MKMRLKLLRGQTYETKTFGSIIYLEEVHVNSQFFRGISNDVVHTYLKNELILPIIDTKDYEKIEDTKYKGD